MAELRAYSLGWDLDHAEVAPLPLDDAAAWGRAEVLFFSPLAVEQLWQHAVGERLRSFRASRRETECWQGLHTLIGRLQALMARGGHLICRLDMPLSRCRVRQRPVAALFPPGSDLNAYEALATVDARFMTIAHTCGRLPAADFELHRIGHPLDEYLWSFEKHLHPLVAAADAPPDWETLAATPAGHAVALVAGEVAWLPALIAPQPRREAQLLVAAARKLLGIAPEAPRPPASTPDAGVGAIQRQERLLESRIAELTAQRDALVAQREARTWLWNRLDAPAGRELGEFVRRAISATGAGRFEPDATTDAAGEETGRFRGRLQDPHGKGPGVTIEFVERPSAASASSCVVPLSELRQALAAAFMHPEGDRGLDRLGPQWRKTPGLWRFHPHELLLDPAERASLGVTEASSCGNESD